MGTNHYLESGGSVQAEHCATCTCSKTVRLHICLSLCMFEGHFTDGEPWLTSWADWRWRTAA